MNALTGRVRRKQVCGGKEVLIKLSDGTLFSVSNLFSITNRKEIIKSHFTNIFGYVYKPCTRVQ